MRRCRACEWAEVEKDGTIYCRGHIPFSVMLELAEADIAISHIIVEDYYANYCNVWSYNEDYECENWDAQRARSPMNFGSL